jgi:hypothetical protein
MAPVKKKARLEKTKAFAPSKLPRLTSKMRKIKRLAKAAKKPRRTVKVLRKSQIMNRAIKKSTRVAKKTLTRVLPAIPAAKN